MSLDEEELKGLKQKINQLKWDIEELENDLRIIGNQVIEIEELINEIL